MSSYVELLNAQRQARSPRLHGQLGEACGETQGGMHGATAGVGSQHVGPAMAAASHTQPSGQRHDESVRSSIRSLRLQRLAEQRALASGRRRQHVQPQLALSAVLRASPQMFDRQKISAVERFVTQLDVLPERYQQATAVYLSKNSLRSLQGIQQFGHARCVSLADNLLASWEVLQPLAAGCPMLESLTLEGNPISTLPFYRPHVIAALPGLRCLDGRVISDAERRGAAENVEQEAALMAIMLRNACSAHKLVRALAGHKGLRKRSPAC